MRHAALYFAALALLMGAAVAVPNPAGVTKEAPGNLPVTNAALRFVSSMLMGKQQIPSTDAQIPGMKHDPSRDGWFSGGQSSSEGRLGEGEGRGTSETEDGNRGFVLLPGSTVTLKSAAGKFCSAQTSLSSTNCGKEAAGANEMFDVISAGGGLVGLRIHSQQRDSCDQVPPGNALEITDQGDWEVAIRNEAGNFCSAFTGGLFVTCEANTVQKYERFQAECVKNCKGLGELAGATKMELVGEITDVKEKLQKAEEQRDMHHQNEMEGKQMAEIEAASKHQVREQNVKQKEEASKENEIKIRMSEESEKGAIQAAETDEKESKSLTAKEAKTKQALLKQQEADHENGRKETTTKVAAAAEKAKQDKALMEERYRLQYAIRALHQSKSYAIQHMHGKDHTSFAPDEKPCLVLEWQNIGKTCTDEFCQKQQSPAPCKLECAATHAHLETVRDDLWNKFRIWNGNDVNHARMMICHKEDPKAEIQDMKHRGVRHMGILQKFAACVPTGKDPNTCYEGQPCELWKCLSMRNCEYTGSSQWSRQGMKEWYNEDIGAANLADLCPFF